MTCAQSEPHCEGIGQVAKPDIPPDRRLRKTVKNKLEDLRQQKERLVAQKAEAETLGKCAGAVEATTELLQLSLSETMQRNSVRSYRI